MSQTFSYSSNYTAADPSLCLVCPLTAAQLEHSALVLNFQLHENDTLRQHFTGALSQFSRINVVLQGKTSLWRETGIQKFGANTAILEKFRGISLYFYTEKGIFKYALSLRRYFYRYCKVEQVVKVG